MKLVKIVNFNVQHFNIQTATEHQHRHFNFKYNVTGQELWYPIQKQIR
jgi:hypothetical protein